MDQRPTLQESLNRFTEKILAFLPDLLTMITILIVGLLIAWIVKILLLRFLKAIQLDRVSERWGFKRVLVKGGVTSPSHLLSQFFYWVILVVTFILAVNALQLAATQILVTQFFNYLPHFFAAIFILIVGYLLAVFLGQAAIIAAVNAQLASPKMYGRAVRWFIAVLALTMALYHLGIAARIILVAFSIILGGSVLALAIAFGWAGKDLARNFLEKLALKKPPEEEPPDHDHISHI